MCQVTKFKAILSWLFQLKWHIPLRFTVERKLQSLDQRFPLPKRKLRKGVLSQTIILFTKWLVCNAFRKWSRHSLLISSCSRSEGKVNGERVAHSQTPESLMQLLPFSKYFTPLFRTGAISVPGGAWSACSISAPRPPKTSCFPSLSPNIDTRKVPASWQQTAKGSSYRFIPPSCGLSSMRFRSGRIQTLWLDGKAEQKYVYMREVHPERGGSWECPLPWWAAHTFGLEGSRENWWSEQGTTKLGNRWDTDPKWENWQSVQLSRAWIGNRKQKNNIDQGKQRTIYKLSHRTFLGRMRVFG